MAELVPGLTGQCSVKVTEANIARTFGSGLASVFSTPYLVALMEGAANDAIKECLTPQQSTVGTEVQISHLAPTPIGMTVTAKAKLEEADGRRLVFTVEAWDDRELVGKGRHERFVINSESFQTKAEKKLDA